MEKTSKKILIVEDDKSYRWILEQSFIVAGFSVAIAEDGEKGLALAEAENPDIILLDILMPKMDGIEVARQIKQKGIKIPVIFLTNMGDLDHITKAMEAIQADYIIKSNVPVDKIVERVKNKLGV